MSKQWYEADADEGLGATIKKLEGTLEPWRWLDAILFRTFYSEPTEDYLANVDGADVYAGQYSRMLESRQRHNLLRAAIETAASMIVQIPEIKVLTLGAGAEKRRSARALAQFSSGVLHANDIESIAWECFLDQCLARVAAVKVFADEGDTVRIERVLPHTLFWNPLEGRAPRNLFTRTPYPRSQLMARFPKFAEIIKGAPEYKPDELFVGVDGVTAPPSDLVELEEGWHLADPGDRDSGRYVASVANKIVTSRPYRLPMHCIVPLRWSPSYSSFAGTPAGDTLLAYQGTLDGMVETIEESQAKGAALRVLLQQGSEIVDDEITNLQGSVIRYKGNPPTFHPGAMLPPQYYEREEKIISRAFAFMGVSYQVASATKPAGVTSGKGQREFRDIAAHRLILHMRNMDRWFERIVRAVLAVASERYKSKDAIVKSPGTKILTKVNWSEIDMTEDEYEVQCIATSALSRHPSARIEDVTDLVNAGMITPQQGLRYAGLPDTEALVDTIFAPQDLAEKQIDAALEGRFIAPEPYQGSEGLQFVVDMGARRYTQEMLQDEPSENLDVLRQLIEAAKMTLNQLSAPATPPPSAPGGPGPGQGVDTSAQVPVNAPAAAPANDNGMPASPAEGEAAAIPAAQ